MASQIFSWLSLHLKFVLFFKNSVSGTLSLKLFLSLQDKVKFDFQEDKKCNGNE